MTTPIIGLHLDKWSDGTRSTVIYVARPARDALPTKITITTRGHGEEHEVTEIRATAHQVGYRVPKLLAVTMEDQILVMVGDEPTSEDGLSFTETSSRRT